MNNMECYIKSFFDHLEIYEDKHNSKNYKNEILASIKIFLTEKSDESAYKIYESFFVAYWIGIQNKENPFLKLPEIMKIFEENAGCLLNKHRDHYVHTAFVFLLGLAIYEKNSSFKGKFNEYALNKIEYPDSYDTENEEFFYRWGIASLFHDIAYPLEITLKQANKYINFIWSYPNENDKHSNIKMKLPEFEKFINLPVLKPNATFEFDFFEKYPTFISDSQKDAISILSHSISKNFGLDFSDINTNITDFVNKMEKNSFIDHGFYSALIMLRWFYYLVKTTNWNPSYFYYPIVDSASAVFLHNYFKHGLKKQPFNLKSMKAKSHPIAYLLILCDELQEWGRNSFGEKDISTSTIEDFNIVITNHKIHVDYKFSTKYDDTILKDKLTTIDELLEISDIFQEGITISEM